MPQVTAEHLFGEKTAADRLADRLNHLSFVQCCLMTQILIDYLGCTSEGLEGYSIADSIEYLDPDGHLPQEVVIDLLLLTTQTRPWLLHLLEDVFCTVHGHVEAQG